MRQWYAAVLFYVISALIVLSGCSGGSDGTPDMKATLPHEDINVSRYQPESNTSWQWQLSGTLNISYDVDIYDVDLFDTTVAEIESMHSDGRKVLCYFSAGSYENWRNDAGSFDASVLGNDLDGWAGEKWLDIRSPLLEPIMKARLDIAQQKGCDGVEADNVDGYTNNTGFALSGDDQLLYNTFLATEAHKRGLAIALKNDLDQITTLEPYFDLIINEQCHQYDECDLLRPFITANKPVFIAEYASKYKTDTAQCDAMCSASRAEGFKTLILAMDLDGSYRDSCD